MESGPKEQPPVLPIKQHMSRSSRCSSVDSDCVVLSPVFLQSENDVFTVPSDCHADQCPIHCRYDSSKHNMRFFSDDLPPPVPKKRLTRTLSLPVAPAPPLSPLPSMSPVQRRPQNFDNPLYMLAPIHDINFHGELEEFEAVRGSPTPSLSLSHLSFDTTDEHLPLLFGSFDDQRVVFQGIQHCQLHFLRRMAKSVEAEIQLHGVTTEKDSSSYQPQDLLLCEGDEPKPIRNTVNHSMNSTQIPGRVPALKENKPQPHVSVQHLISHFQPVCDSNVQQSADPSHPETSDCTPANPPAGCSTESIQDPMNPNLPCVQFILQKGHSVSGGRELPQATLEDFVQQSSLMQDVDGLDYDRQVCFLLLQILIGSQHLYNISATAAELGPREIILVWPNKDQEEGGGKDGCDIMKEKGKSIQMFWRSHGSPRVVLIPLSPALSVPAPFTYIKSQIRSLIQFCLKSQETQPIVGSVPAQSRSSYRTGLLHMASLLQTETREPQMSDMVNMVQVLLWGPHLPLLRQRGPVTNAVNNWLTIKRALLLMKFAERGLIQDKLALDWEDCLCLQYLSFTDPEVIVSAAGQFWLLWGLD